METKFKSMLDDACFRVDRGQGVKGVINRKYRPIFEFLMDLAGKYLDGSRMSSVSLHEGEDSLDFEGRREKYLFLNKNEKNQQGRIILADNNESPFMKTFKGRPAEVKRKVEEVEFEDLYFTYYEREKFRDYVGLEKYQKGLKGILELIYSKLREHVEKKTRSDHKKKLEEKMEEFDKCFK